MAIFKCKMCGGQLEITEGTSVCTCDYCGTEQTLPRLDTDKKANLYDRANHFRRNNDFDKAMSIYEQILNEDNTDAEAYWSLVLCRYGIEYVEDPVSHKRIPTINRAQYTSIYADEDYKAAIQYADFLQKNVYEQEAKTIDEIQKRILAISEKEEPFDVFICYKESDSNGRRTQDSVLANDLYHQLSQEGFKVFFAKITLEDKLGQEYEPYIFAALNSAKVMVVLGTKPEYFNAVWVKNEWSRYLALVKQSAGKKMLIPAYRDMDPYDLPEEFSHLQAQDMSKLGFMQDLIRGIKKILDVEKAKSVTKETVVVQQGSNNSNALIKRGKMALEDGEWQKADEFFEEVLNQDAECAEAYLGKLISKYRCSNISALTQYYISKYESSENEKLVACPEALSRIDAAVSRYSVRDYLSDAEIRKHYIFDRTYVSELSCRKMQKEKQMFELSSEKLLVRAQQYAMGETKNSIDKMIEDITSALDTRIFIAEQADNESIVNIKSTYEMHLNDADLKVQKFYNTALERQESTYKSRVNQMNQARTMSDYEKVCELLSNMHGYKDTGVLASRCRGEIARLKEEERQEIERRENVRRKEVERLAKKKKVITAITSAVIAACLVAYLVVTKVVIPNNNYNDAIALMNSEKYEEAIAAFDALDGYKDSSNQITICNEKILDAQYNDAVALMNDGNYGEAIVAFEVLDGYKDSSNQISVCNEKILDIQYNCAIELMNNEKYEEAIAAFETLGGYKNSRNQIRLCEELITEREYKKAIEFLNSGDYIEAYKLFVSIDGYDESEVYIESICNSHPYISLVLASQGDCIKFGNYNGNTEWEVLNIVNGKMLVISRYALEKLPYNTERTSYRWGSCTWESCTLRRWLNETYINSAFTSDEQALILTTNLENLANPGWVGGPDGNNTTDKVFLLSIDEVDRYFTSDSDLIVTLGSGSPIAWWLRSPGIYGYDAAYVRSNGDVQENGTYVDSNTIAVRPAMWIDISDL